MVEKKPEELCPLVDCDVEEKKHKEGPRKRSFKTPKFLKTCFKGVMYAKVILDMINKIWSWFEDM